MNTMNIRAGKKSRTLGFSRGSDNRPAANEGGREVILWLLAAAHLAAAVVLVWLIDSGGGPPLEAAFDALVYADAALVGIWTGWGRHSKATGFLGVGLATLTAAVCSWGSLRHTLGALTGPGNDMWVITWLVLFAVGLSLLTMAMVVAVLLYLRQRGIDLCLGEPPNATGELPPVRFSLRQMFLLMAVTGILLKLGPVANAYLNDYRSYLCSTVALLSGGVCLGSVALVAAWAVFGGPPSAGRIVTALALAAVFGLFPPYYFPYLLSDNFAASVAVTCLESLVVMASLAVVRASGYRLVQYRVAGAEPAD
ncbi:MAG TPA: hypothetical protein VNH11_33075 [Pirellulales bacterium]|nr:hypothetical protein [Pirellulales bacterium]